ncbi:MAG: PilZ domain-containing protein [Candidatus Omnitrophota bacterium]
MERRRYIRVEAQAEVKFELQHLAISKESIHKTPAIAKNLSIEGVCFICERDIAKGTVISLNILLPLEDRPLRLDGQIAWSRPLELSSGRKMREIGVKIFSLEKSDESRFVKFITERVAQETRRKFPPKKQ